MDGLRKSIPKPIRTFARTVSGKTREVAERFAFELALRRSAPVLVFQMGSVGSTSVHHALSNVYPGLVAHGHVLRADCPDWRIRKIHRSIHSRKQIWKVISLTRDPIARNISMFFHDFRRTTGADNPADYTTEELKDLFLRLYDHGIPLRWFDGQVKTHFGIDVYSQPFPDTGFRVYQNNWYELLVLRSELSNETKANRIRDFLGMSSLDLNNINVASKKPYAESYARFRQTVRLPDPYLRWMRQSRYYRHFYGNDRSYD